MVNRRDFLKLSVATAAGAPALAQQNAQARETAMTTRGGEDYSPLSGTKRQAIATACALCPGRCAAIGYVESGQIVKIEGHPDSHRTLGALCAKGQAGINQVYDPDRILQPLKRIGKRGEGKWEKISWDAALGELTGRLKALRDRGEPEKFLFHHGWISASADRLINKVFLPAYGTATVADNACLTQSARHTAHELTVGSYHDGWDFDNTRFVLNFGSNVMEAHTNHVALARRLSSAMVERNLKMVTFDVRLSNTGAKSHDWIQVKPGTDGAIALAMCNVVMSKELYRGRGETFLEFCQVTSNPSASMDEKIALLKDHLSAYTPEWAAQISGVDAGKISDIAVEFASTGPACVISSRGANAHNNGVETERAIQMLAAITGNIDCPGGRCLGVAPQWNYPAGPENKPAPRKLDILYGVDEQVAIPVHGVGREVLRMIEAGTGGRPEVYLWYHYNPVFSNGNIRKSIEILKDESLIPFTVAVTPFYDESAALADLILPDTVYLETYDFEDAISPTQVPEYCIRQPVAPPQGEARDFKDVCCDLAQRMGFPLGFKSAEEFVEQSCGLTPDVERNAGGFEGMKERGVWSDKEAKPAYYSYKKPVSAETLQTDGVIFDQATGVYWNWKAAGVSSEGEALTVGYRRAATGYKGYVAQKIGDSVYQGFGPQGLSKSGYFELYSPIMEEKGLPPLPTYVAIPEHQGMKTDELILTTFRVNVQTLSRTANCMWLDEINDGNPAWINPRTATARGIVDGDRIKISTGLGAIEATAKVTENVVPGVIAISSHGGHWEYGRYASDKKAPFAIDQDAPHEDLKWWANQGANPNWIIDAVGDPVSGQPRWMDTVVSVSKA